MLEEPSGGEIMFKSEQISYKPKDKNRFRSRVGMVFQSFNLFANMNVLKNCMIGMQIAIQMLTLVSMYQMHRLMTQLMYLQRLQLMLVV